MGLTPGASKQHRLLWVVVLWHDVEPLVPHDVSAARSKRPSSTGDMPGVSLMRAAAEADATKAAARRAAICECMVGWTGDEESVKEICRLYMNHDGYARQGCQKQHGLRGAHGDDEDRRPPEVSLGRSTHMLSEKHASNCRELCTCLTGGHAHHPSFDIPN